MQLNQNNNVVVENLEGRTMMSAVPLNTAEVAFNGGLQLQITASANNSKITVTKTQAGLVIGNTGGWTKTVSDPITSLVIRGAGGNNSIVVDASVTLDCTINGGGVSDTLVSGSGNDTLVGGSGKNVMQAGNGNDQLVCIGSTSDTLVGGAGRDTFWTDNSKTEKVLDLTNIDAIHKVASYYNTTELSTATKKLAAKGKVVATTQIAEPGVDGGMHYADFSANPIFSSNGPAENDVMQGQCGDCYFLSVLSSTAKIDPARISQSIVGLGNGTAIVALNKNGTTVYVHETEMLAVEGNGTVAYANVGAQSSTWVSLTEKAWTYVRMNPTSYDSISSGWMDETYRALGANKPVSSYSFNNATSLLALVQKDLAAGMSVTYATTSSNVSAGMISGHAYTVDAVTTNAQGTVVGLTLRNPWGVNADGTGNGYITLSGADALADFTGIVAAAV